MLDAVTDFKLLTDPALLDSKLRELWVYWLSRRPENSLPGRRDIDPLDIPRLMPYVALVDILRDPLDYRYRLTGTKFVEMIGHDRTGMRAREIFTGPLLETTVALIGRLIESGAPLAFEGRLFWIDKAYYRFQTLILPLAADGKMVDMAVMGLDFRLDD
jgi:hypothetical protein